MIIGMGIDMVDIRRIEKLLDDSGDKFAERSFTEVEREYATKKSSQTASIYAKRFAAKEAFSKAMGTGIGASVGLKEIEVINNEQGKPELHLYGKAKEWLQERDAIAHVSLSDEYPYAIAQVLIEGPSAQD